MVDAEIFIRGIGERTEELCRVLIEKQVPAKQVTLVREAPFSKALELCFKEGIRKDRKWTLCIDADILIRTNAIKDLISFANEQDISIFKIVPYMLDHFFGTYRAGGMHLYRTSMLEMAIDLIPAEGESLRPESTVFLGMEKLGFGMIPAPLLLSLHDYEQYYMDIFRKCFVFAHKWESWLPEFVSLWRQQMDVNEDFKYALLGLAAGIATFDGVRIDKNRVPSHLLESFVEGRLSEKTEIDLLSFNTNSIESLLDSRSDSFHKEVVGPWNKQIENQKEQKRTLVFHACYRLAQSMIRSGEGLKEHLIHR